ncbi:MAG TPA: hypothetical protein DIW45_02740 [Erythrobacter sp.]|nr:hypothetical protein [Erythrobacter sp.]
MAMKWVAQVAAPAVTADRKHQWIQASPLSVMVLRKRVAETIEPAMHISAAMSTNHKLCSYRMQPMMRMGFLRFRLVFAGKSRFGLACKG